MDEIKQPMLHDAIAPELDRLAELTELANRLDAELDSDPRYTQLSAIRGDIALCEESIKATLKGSGVKVATIQSAGYEAVLQTRQSKGAVTYDIPAIEKQPWGAGCIVKAVNATVFKAIVTSLSLDMNLFATTEPGTETKAVTIRKVEDKKP